jgi:hypothetical protein
MLYDPKWEKQIETPAPLLRFIAWLEKQPAEVEYDYTQPARCAIAQWLKSEGAADFVLISKKIDELFGPMANTIVNPHQGNDMTFGGALKRARAFQAR